MALCAKGQVRAGGELAGARAAAGRYSTGSAAPGPHPGRQARAVLGLAALSAGNLAEADRQLSRADEIEESSHNREPGTTGSTPIMPRR